MGGPSFSGSKSVKRGVIEGDIEGGLGLLNDKSSAGGERGLASGSAGISQGGSTGSILMVVLMRGEEGLEEEEAIFFLRGEEESLRGELGSEWRLEVDKRWIGDCSCGVAAVFAIVFSRCTLKNFCFCCASSARPRRGCSVCTRA